LCLFADSGDCAGKIEAAHLDFAGGKGIGTKVADRHCVPMCSYHHGLQHTKGWRTFMARLKTTQAELLAMAAWLWNKWPGRREWERKMER
jgi:hypothetical protein